MNLKIIKKIAPFYRKQFDILQKGAILYVETKKPKEKRNEIGKHNASKNKNKRTIFV